MGRTIRGSVGIRWATRGVLVVVAAGMVVGCGGPSITGRGTEPSARPITPVTVPGLRGCDQLERDGTRREDSDGRLPTLEVPCLTQRRTVDVSALGGKPVVVNLWASWCGPCREEIPRLAQAARETPDVTFVGINTRDDPERASSFLADVDASYPQLVDLDGIVLDSVGVRGLPVTLALDSGGRIVDKVIGGVSDERLTKLLAALSAE